MPDLNLAAARLLGEPCEVLTWYPTVVIRCKCIEQMTNLLVLTPAAIAECPACHGRYKINGVTPNGPQIAYAPPSSTVGS